jgi:hypothetical protein
MSPTPEPPQFSIVPQGAPFRASAQTYSPPWLLGYVGARYVYSAAIQWDTLAEFTRLGVIQRYPSLAQSSALTPLGKDRRIFRGLSETDAHYAERLRLFKRTWKLAGNAPTVLRQLWELMAPDAVRIRYVVNGYDGVPGAGTQFADWWTIDATGLSFERVAPSNWNWDNQFGFNIRFWVIIYRDDLVPAKWGVPPYEWAEPGLFWGGAPGSPRDWVVDAFNIVETFKAAGSHMGPWPDFNGGLIVADPGFTGAPWGPAGPFAPSTAPGYPMPDGTFNDYNSRSPGSIYISGL